MKKVLRFIGNALLLILAVIVFLWFVVYVGSLVIEFVMLPFCQPQ